MKALHQLTEGYSKRPRRQVGNIIVSIKDIQLMGNSQKKESKKKNDHDDHIAILCLKDPEKIV